MKEVEFMDLYSVRREFVVEGASKVDSIVEQEKRNRVTETVCLCPEKRHAILYISATLTCSCGFMIFLIFGPGLVLFNLDRLGVHEFWAILRTKKTRKCRT